MQAIQQELTIRKDNILEIHSPLLKSGEHVEVILLLKEKTQETTGLFSLFGAGKGAFSTPEEADAFIYKERDLWE